MAKKSAIFPETIALYDKLIATNTDVVRRGEYKTKLFEAYGVVKKDWVVVPDALLRKTAELRKYFDLSYRHVKTLKPKR